MPQPMLPLSLISESTPLLYIYTICVPGWEVALRPRVTERRFLILYHGDVVHVALLGDALAGSPPRTAP